MYLLVYIFGCCWCLSSIFAQNVNFHEKKRFDRSVNPTLNLITAEQIIPIENPNLLLDKIRQIRAYKLPERGLCFIEKLPHPKIEVVTLKQLSERQAMAIMGDKLYQFCNKMVKFLLQEGNDEIMGINANNNINPDNNINNNANQDIAITSNNDNRNVNNNNGRTNSLLKPSVLPGGILMPTDAIDAQNNGFGNTEIEVNGIDDTNNPVIQIKDMSNFGADKNNVNNRGVDKNGITRISIGIHQVLQIGPHEIVIDKKRKPSTLPGIPDYPDHIGPPIAVHPVLPPLVPTAGHFPGKTHHPEVEVGPYPPISPNHPTIEPGPDPSVQPISSEIKIDKKEKDRNKINIDDANVDGMFPNDVDSDNEITVGNGSDNTAEIGVDATGLRIINSDDYAADENVLHVNVVDRNGVDRNKEYKYMKGNTKRKNYSNRKLNLQKAQNIIRSDKLRNLRTIYNADIPRNKRKIQRTKREALPSMPKFHGQTQSQYLNGPEGKDGKAEAEATHKFSRVLVSGSSGMGQAQSMSFGSDGCTDCSESDKKINVPDNRQNFVISQESEPTGNTAGKYSTRTNFESITPGTRPDNIFYQSGTQPGMLPPTFRLPQQSDINFPLGFIPGMQIPREGTNIGNQRQQNGKILPSVQMPNTGSQASDGLTYPSIIPGVPKTETYPKISAGNPALPIGTYSEVVPYPSIDRIGPYTNSMTPGTQTAGNTYPANRHENIPTGTQILDSSKYPSGAQIVRDNVPIAQLSRDNMYQPNIPIVGPIIPNSQVPVRNAYPSGVQTGENQPLSSQIPVQNVYPNIQLTGYNTPNFQTPGESILSTGKQMVDCIPNIQLPAGNIYPSGTKILGSTVPQNQIPVQYLPFVQPSENTPKGGVYVSNTQVSQGRIPETQLPQVSNYSPVKQLTGSNISKTPVSDGISYAPNPQIIKNNSPNTQMPDQIRYMPGMQVFTGDNTGTSTPGQVVYLPNPQVIRNSAPATQLPAGTIYSPGVQNIGPNNAGLQSPQQTFYPLNLQSEQGGISKNQEQADSLSNVKIFEGSLSRPPNNIITYPSGMQIIGSNTPIAQIPGRIAYPDGTQTMGGGTPISQIPSRLLYSPGTQISGNNNPVSQIPSRIVFPSNTQIVADKNPTYQVPDRAAYPAGPNTQGIQTPNGVSYVPGAQVATNTQTGDQIPKQILYPPTTQIRGSDSSIPLMPRGEYQLPQGNMYIPGVQFVGTATPGNAVQGGNIYPIGSQIPGGVYNPVSTSDFPTAINGLYPGVIVPGNINKPSGTYTDKIPNTGIVGSTSSESIKPSMRGDIPGTVIYPATQENGATQSGISTNGEKYPSQPNGQVSYPNTNINAGNPIQYPIIIGSQQYPGSGVIVPDSKGLLSGSNQNIPSVSSGIGGTGEKSTVLNQPPNAVVGTDDGSNSQAMSSVKQGEDGTLASASAEGKHGHGTAKSQVSGIYNGNGSFSAQAGTSDDTKSAQTQVSGGKEGAKSSAQGSGGIGKSQTQVQLNSESGATSTNAQTNGWNHGTNSQVQASAKGGMADAQANGEGQTSSQAQIGFQPYVNRNEKFEKLENPFRGGGTASAQSGTFRGQSQSQLQGSFHYGISYSGAAQAASGSGSAALRKPFNFTNSDPNLFKHFTLEENEKVNLPDATPKEHLEASGTSSRQTVIAITPRNTYLKKKNIPETARRQPFEISNIDDEYEEYDEEDYGDSEFVQPTGSDRVKQRMRIFTNTRNGIKHEKRKDQINEFSLPEYMASADKEKVTSKIEKKMIQENSTLSNKTMINSKNETTASKPSSDTKSLHSDRVGGIYYGGLKSSEVTESSSPRTNFVSVSNNVAGKIDDKNLTKKFEHRYYTKSSTCGYFTFSCNIVYGSNGRRKICKPKMPTFSDGTPKC